MRCFKNIFILLLCSVTSFCFAQNHNRERMWVLPDSVGINFNTVTPTIFSSNESGCFNPGDGTQCEAVSCISDTSGNLLFYTNGWKIYDRNNEVMPNGDSIWCGISSTNGIVTIPYPEDDSLYYLFYINLGLMGTSPGIYYSIINMNKNGGNGEVEPTIKNKEAFLLNSLGEQITAVKHGNGRDWWIIGKNGNYYFKILVTPNGIADTSLQEIGISSGAMGWFTIGEISYSKNGDKIASSVAAINTVEQMNFDRCSGQLSDLVIHDFNLPWSAYDGSYGCCFSPDGNIVYCTFADTLYQLKSNGDSLDIIYKVGNPYVGMNYWFSQMELAPNNVIYFPICYANNPSFNFSFYNMNLCTIEFPDSLGASCNVQLNNFNLGGKRCSFGLPNMPNYDLGRLVDSPCDTLYNSVNEKIAKEKSIVRIYPNPANNELTIEILNGIAPKQIEITNSLGVTVKQLHQTKPTSQLNIKQLPAGVYFVKVKMQNGSVTVRRFVKF